MVDGMELVERGGGGGNAGTSSAVHHHHHPDLLPSEPSFGVIDFLTCPISKQPFIAACKRQLCWEPALYILVMHDVKQQGLLEQDPPTDQAWMTIQQIYIDYIQPGSVFEIPLSYALRKILVTKFGSLEAINEKMKTKKKRGSSGSSSSTSSSSSSSSSSSNRHHLIWKPARVYSADALTPLWEEEENRDEGCGGSNGGHEAVVAASRVGEGCGGDNDHGGGSAHGGGAPTTTTTTTVVAITKEDHLPVPVIPPLIRAHTDFDLCVTALQAASAQMVDLLKRLVGGHLA